MTSQPESFEDLAVELSFDALTREVSWVYTQGLAWHGYPELAARLPRPAPGHPGEAGALAVFLMAALVTLGTRMLALEGFLDAAEIPPWTSTLGGAEVSVWVSGFDDLEAPLPPALLAEDVMLVTCSLWDTEPVRP